MTPQAVRLGRFFHLFFQLVSRRYERGSIMVTSNRSVGKWGEVFGDAVVATAILDRLLHQPRADDHRGELRLREKRRARRAQRPRRGPLAQASA